MSTLPHDQVPLWAPLYGATPVEAVRRFFRKYAVFTGRASRSEYWWFALTNALVYLVFYLLTLLGFLVGTDGSGAAGPLWPLGALGAVVLVVWFLGTLVPSIALTVRRFHDASNSGLLVLLGLIPYVGGLIVFIFSLLPSNPLGRRFDAPGGVPVWQSGMPYGQFPPAPGEPDTPVALPAYPALAYPPASPYPAPVAPPPAYPQAAYPPAAYPPPVATPDAVTPPPAVPPPPPTAPPQAAPQSGPGSSDRPGWTPPAGS